MIAKISAWKMVQWQPRGKLSLVPEVAPYTPAFIPVTVLDWSVNQTSPCDGRIEFRENSQSSRVLQTLEVRWTEGTRSCFINSSGDSINVYPQPPRWPHDSADSVISILRPDKQIPPITKRKLLYWLRFMELKTLKASNTGKLDSFTMWIYKQLLRIPWTADRSNTSTLKELKVKDVNYSK